MRSRQQSNEITTTMVRVLDVRWFNGVRGGLVGVVCCEMDDEHDLSPDPRCVIRYFIGAADGHDEQLDKQTIALWGARFPDPVGALLFGR